MRRILASSTPVSWPSCIARCARRSLTPSLRQVHRRYGEPALELGCGDGDPTLDLVARGLDVEGLDASPDMLDRCRHRARAAGVAVTLHQQSIQRMDLAKRYNSIYLAGVTVNLLPDDDTATTGPRA